MESQNESIGTQGATKSINSRQNSPGSNEANSGPRLATRDGQPVPPPQRKFKFMVGPSANNKFFNAKELAWDDLVGVFADHRETDKKDGLCFIPAVWAGERRHASSVTHVTCLVYDIDGGMTRDEIEAILDQHPAKALAYSTYSHMTTQTFIKVDSYDKWASRAGQPEEPTPDSMTLYLASVKKEHLTNVTFDLERHHIEGGLHYLLKHAPIAKVRILFPLEQPIEIAKLARTTKDAIEVYKSIYFGYAQHLGLNIDTSTSDPSRLHYLPSHPKGRDDWFVNGYHLDDEAVPFTDWTKYPRVALKNTKRVVGRDGKLAPKSYDHYIVKDADGVDIDLKRWAKMKAQDFDIEGCLQMYAPDLCGQSRASGAGCHVVCPFEDEHGTGGGQGTFCAPGEGDRGFTIFCTHNSCQSEGRDRLDYLREYILQGHLTAQHIEYITPEQEAEAKVADQEAAEKSAVETASQLNGESDSGSVQAALFALLAVKAQTPREKVLKLISKETGVSIAALRADLKALEKVDKKVAHADADRPDEHVHDLTAFYNWDRQDFLVTTQRVVEVLRAANRERPFLFNRLGAGPVRLKESVLRNPKTGKASEPILVCNPLDASGLKHEITARTKWAKTDQNGVPRYRACPCDVVDHILSDTHHDYWELKAILDTPYFAPDGTLVVESGYSEATGYYLSLQAGLEIAPLPERITRRDVRRALRSIMDVIGDFPFRDIKNLSGKSSKVNFLAKLITPIVRAMINGPTPIFVTQKPTPGTGASLLEKILCLILFGAPAQAQSEKSNDDEWRKAIFAALLSGQRAIFLENVKHKLESHVLANATTADIFEDRVLGASEMQKARVQCLWSVAGNNVRMSGELARRACVTRLDADMVDPAKGRTFRHANLEDYVRSNRSELVRSLLIICAYWVQSGQPSSTTAPLASFENWTRVVGGILECAGVTGFMDNRSEARRELTDGDDAEALESFAAEWLGRFGTKAVPLGILDCERQDALRHEVHVTTPSTLSDLLYVCRDWLPMRFMNRAADKWPNALGRELSKKVGVWMRLPDGREVKILKDPTERGVTYSLEERAGSQS